MSGTGPALACWNNGSTGHDELWVAYTGSDGNIYVGYFDGNTSSRSLHYGGSIGEQSQSSPGLVAHSLNGPKLWLDWRGTNSAHNLNVEYSSNGYQWYGQGFRPPISNKDVINQYASSGVGIAYLPAGNVPGFYLTWPGTNGSEPNLNSGHYTPGSGSLNNTAVLSATLYPDEAAASSGQGGQFGAWLLYLPFISTSGEVDVEESESGDAGSWNLILTGGQGVDGVSAGVQTNNLQSLTWSDGQSDIWFLSDYNFSPS
jgi:hypothetical protein